MPVLRGKSSLRWLLFLVIGFTGLLLLGALAWCWLRDAFAEDPYVKRGTLDYYLAIDPVIRHCPLIALVGDPEYYSTCGDGAKLPGCQVAYSSDADKKKIARETHDCLVKNGFIPKSENANGDRLEYSGVDEKIEVQFVEPEGPPTCAVIRLYY